MQHKNDWSAQHGHASSFPCTSVGVLMLGTTAWLTWVPGIAGGQQQELTAICNILSAVLAVEHRAIQPHLIQIWQLLWVAAKGGQAYTRPKQRM